MILRPVSPESPIGPPTTKRPVGLMKNLVLGVTKPAGSTGFTLSSIAGAYFPALPFLQPGMFTVGASAPVFGLIGALYHYGRTGSESIRQMALSIMIQAALFGLLVTGIDNYAHLGGFAGGYFMSAFLNPFSRERGDHMIAAMLCVAASVLAIIASLVVGFPGAR